MDLFKCFCDVPLMLKSALFKFLQRTYDVLCKGDVFSFSLLLSTGGRGVSPPGVNSRGVCMEGGGVRAYLTLHGINQLTCCQKEEL